MIPLLRGKSETVRNQAASELAAYGRRARAAVSVLTALIERKNAESKLDTIAVKFTLEAIQGSEGQQKGERGT